MPSWRNWNRKPKPFRWPKLGERGYDGNTTPGYHESQLRRGLVPCYWRRTGHSEAELSAMLNEANAIVAGVFYDRDTYIADVIRRQSDIVTEYRATPFPDDTVS